MTFSIKNSLPFMEYFRDSSGKEWDRGAFDYAIVISSVHEEYEIHPLCDWLCDNCTENFIVLKKTYENIAGGSNNNKLRWERRKSYGAQADGVYRSHNFSTKYEFRLHKCDMTGFRLTWIL